MTEPTNPPELPADLPAIIASLREGMTITYAHLDAQLKPVGGLKNLLLILPGMLGPIDAKVLDGLRSIIDRKLPLNLTVSVPDEGLTFTAHVR